MTNKEVYALTTLALALSNALEKVTDSDARAHLDEIEKHVLAIMRNASHEPTLSGN